MPLDQAWGIPGTTMQIAHDLPGSIVPMSERVKQASRGAPFEYARSTCQDGFGVVIADGFGPEHVAAAAERLLADGQ